MKKFTKRYQLWTYNDGGYSLTEYDTLIEVLQAEKYSADWYITEAIEHGHVNFASLETNE